MLHALPNSIPPETNELPIAGGPREIFLRAAGRSACVHHDPKSDAAHSPVHRYMVEAQENQGMTRTSYGDSRPENSEENDLARRVGKLVPRNPCDTTILLEFRVAANEWRDRTATVSERIDSAAIQASTFSIPAHRNIQSARRLPGTIKMWCGSHS